MISCQGSGASRWLAAFLMAALGASAADVVTYEEFGAVGDGVHDDQAAIVAAHAAANERKLPVRAKDGATYLIGGGAKTAVIMTDVDFGKAKFIVDDTHVEKRGCPIFRVPSGLQSYPVTGITGLRKGQTNLGVTLRGVAMVRVQDANVRQFIRSGGNANEGQAKQELLLVKPNGDIDRHTPVVQEFETVTSAVAFPVDKTPLTIRGGDFTTLHNQENHELKNQGYFGRGFQVMRSRVRIEGLRHELKGQGETAAPYGGFLGFSYCVGVRVKDCVLSAHRNICTQGTYDIGAGNAIGLTFVNCREMTDILDTGNWGIFGSNYCRDITFDGCEFSRFDAHCGVMNATIRNSKIGFVGINAIGWGTFLVEDSTVYGRCFFNLRSDYGSTWDGEFVVRNCIYVPACGKTACGVLVGGRNDGKHDYGYVCRMPRKIMIDGLKIDDRNHPANYEGAWIFGDLCPANSSKDFTAQYPYHVTEEVVLKNIATASGERLRVSPNDFMFKDVKIERDGMRKWKVPAKSPVGDSAAAL